MRRKDFLVTNCTMRWDWPAFRGDPNNQPSIREELVADQDLAVAGEMIATIQHRPAHLPDVPRTLHTWSPD